MSPVRLAAFAPSRSSGPPALKPLLLAMAAVGALGAATGLRAQSLAPVTISATRSEAAPFDVPASVDVIDGERLRGDGRAQLNLSESLSLVPGLSARDRQNQAQDLQLSVRGFGARSTFGVRGVRIYVDGIPATMPDGQGQLSHIDIGSASRVEVLRGPFSSLYGNSSGGVVQVFTEAGEGPPVVTPGVAFGSDGFFRAGVKASGGTAAPDSAPSAVNFGYALDASHFRTDGFRDHSAAERDQANGITPRSIVKRIRDLIDGVYSEKSGKDAEKLEIQKAQVEDMSEKDIAREIKRLEKQMIEHAKNLEFEKAGKIRDQLHVLKQQAFGAPGTDNLAPAASAARK